MCFDYSALIGRIIEKYGNRYAFAYAIGLSERSLSLKLNDKIGWRDSEIAKACELLSIAREEIQVYFFNYKVQNNRTKGGTLWNKSR
ncbi:TPA: DUF739 family protein [Staphylococcus aureus]|nr:DUF739 family protein [Staphylococcus aureus]HDG5794412.1 DUF739 family protein [Staphylococcus aureus]HDG5925977.1 DUF739 family protein [Staphylococcus aureus]